MAVMKDDLIDVIEVLRKRMKFAAVIGPEFLFLNVVEYAYFKAHEWIEFEQGRQFTSVHCPICPVHTEVKVVEQIPT